MNQTDKEKIHTFFILNLGLNIFDGIRWFHFQSDGFSGQSFHKDLHDYRDNRIANFKTAKRICLKLD